MHRLIAFEFVAAADGPQFVRLTRKGIVVLQLAFVTWTAVDISALGLEFEAFEDLGVEGHGLGHPYWNADVPSWLGQFDEVAEAKRVLAIRNVALQEARRSALVM